MAPLLGFIISEKDEFYIISFTRKRLSELVLEDSSKYQDIFENGQDDVLKWAKDVKVSKAWGGDKEFDVFARITGLAIHVLNSECLRIQGTTHFSLHCSENADEADFWASSQISHHVLSRRV